MVDNYCQMRELHRAYVIYMKWLGFKQTEIEVEHDARKEGKSSYNFKKRLNMALSILTSQSDKLLKLMVMCGFGLTLVSAIVLLALVVNYFVNHVTVGWTSTIAAICMVGGLLMVSIGVVGVYVGNIFMQVKERPLYVTRQIKNARN